MTEIKQINKDVTNIIDVAVNYWANFLKDPSTVVHDNGESSQFGMLNALNKLANAGMDYGEGKVDTFKLVLSTLIEKGLEEREVMIVRVDYHPDSNLTAALDKSLGTYNDMAVFPCKTSMRINKVVGKVEVSEGYGKPWKTLCSNVDNTNMLNHDYKYVIFGAKSGEVQIVINFKYYLCKLDVAALGLNLEADTIVVSNIDGKFYASKLLTGVDVDLPRVEIIVKDYVGELNDEE